MKILIAGKGFIGEKTGKKLEKNHKVKYLDIDPAADIFQDITEQFKLEEDFDILIHTVGLPPGFHNKKEYEKLHVKGTENLVKALNPDKIIYISALGVENIDHPFMNTKEEAEKIIKEAEADHVIIRPSTVYGHPNKLLDMIKKFSVTRLFPKITTKTQPIHIDDLTQVIEKRVEKRRNQTLKIAGLQKISIGNLAKHLYHKQDKKCLLIPLPFLKTQIKILSYILPPPFLKENTKLLENDNTTNENDTPSIINPKKIFDEKYTETV